MLDDVKVIVTNAAGERSRDKSLENIIIIILLQPNSVEVGIGVLSEIQKTCTQSP